MDISSTLVFNVVDVETANIDHSSICQVGIVHIRNGELEEEWETLINPEDWFDPYNIGIHGIDEERVRDAPTFPQVYPEICRRVHSSVLVSHMPFDRTAFNRASEKYGLEKLQVTWMDSARVARRTWPRYKDRGYGLKNIASDLGISFKHHDALEDAKAAAQVIIEACRESERDIQGWLQELEKRPAKSSYRPRPPIRREGIGDGPLSGETIAFTGTLIKDGRRITREEAADSAAEAGGDVLPRVTKEVTVLVLGIQNIDRLKDEKSRKHKDAESYGAKILLASDFFELIDF